ncbi:hypothetical protein WICPIJ_005494 [Wickerhamomyces pijperi]|uniref:Uncharacterized protein n=1 Tax=Wickerhamomyces pijperi TaxID=599730 RepID=A0A9P8Q5K9_WICPI|nr:hypothetical protein WICPIJ_005494 [Wickerhamomyces pijperi]
MAKAVGLGVDIGVEDTHDIVEEEEDHECHVEAVDADGSVAGMEVGMDMVDVDCSTSLDLDVAASVALAVDVDVA